MAPSSQTSSPPPAMPENATNNSVVPHPLQCPRCSSSNTKFCYYNNYSLSQPRHFCKSCKRYWTRGGTLRNVPVGGGCRKNSKRPKRPTPANPKIDLPLPQASTHTTTNTNIISGGSNNTLLYMNINPVNFPFSSFGSTRVCGDSNTGIDFQPQVNGLGLGFSSGLMPADYDSSIFCGSSSASTMASLLAWKIEGDQNGFGWNPDPNPNTSLEQINCYYSDPSPLIGAWFDPSNSNIGSSVPSLI